jgi:hypothetical protein
MSGPDATPSHSSAEDPPRAAFFLERARADHTAGDVDAANENYLIALSFDPDLVEAHVGLATLRMPGDNYVAWLDRLQRHLAPAAYLEIGIARGETLALARPPTCAIGVDPAPTINVPFQTETHIFRETSDAFFAQDRLSSVLAGRGVGLAFIDGLHEFAQSLRDFVNVEAVCDRRSVVLMHDTVPLDEVTQRPERQRRFYTGDVWKTVLCLKAFRPDLRVVTISTPWTGLTMITGLDPQSRVLVDRFDEAVARFADTPYSEIERDLRSALNMAPNDWSPIEDSLRELKLERPSRP